MQAALEKARDEADEARDRMQGALGQSQQEAQRAEHAIEQLRLTQAVAEQSRNDAAAAQQARLAAESKLEEILQDNKEVGPPELKYTSWNLIWHMTLHVTSLATQVMGHHLCTSVIALSSVMCVCVCSCLQPYSIWSRTGLPRPPGCLPSCRRRMQTLSVHWRLLPQRMQTCMLSSRRGPAEACAR